MCVLAPYGAHIYRAVGMFDGLALATVTASLSGTVTDPSGAAIRGATVSAVCTDTRIKQSQTTKEQGFYSFQTLPLGHYDSEVQQAGFKVYRHTGLLVVRQELA